MRTTLDIQDELLISAKKMAAESHRTLTSVVEEALRATLQSKKSPSLKTFKMRTFKGSGLKPGVDLDDTASLTAYLESGKDDSYRR